MAATAPSTSLVPVQPVFTDAGRLALAGFLAGYRDRSGVRGRADRARPAMTIRRAPLCIFVNKFLTVTFTGFKAVRYCRVPFAEFHYSMS